MSPFSIERVGTPVRIYAVTGLIVRSALKRKQRGLETLIRRSYCKIKRSIISRIGRRLLKIRESTGERTQKNASKCVKTGEEKTKTTIRTGCKQTCNINFGLDYGIGFMLL
jgi:hypothetical protein